MGPTAEQMRRAREAGLAAAHRGFSRESCVFASLTYLYDAWNDGYREGQTSSSKGDSVMTANPATPEEEGDDQDDHENNLRPVGGKRGHVIHGRYGKNPFRNRSDISHLAVARLRRRAFRHQCNALPQRTQDYMAHSRC